MKVKESENVGLKLNIQKTKIMAFGPITSWQIDGETMTGFIYLFIDSKIIAVGDWSSDVCSSDLHCFHSFPIYFPCSDGTKCHDLHFLNLEF